MFDAKDIQMAHKRDHSAQSEGFYLLCGYRVTGFSSISVFPLNFFPSNLECMIHVIIVVPAKNTTSEAKIIVFIEERTQMEDIVALRGQVGV